MKDLLTAVTESVVALLDSARPAESSLVGWPGRVTDIEETPWVSVRADYAGLAERVPEVGDRRLVAVSIACRFPEQVPGQSAFWVDDTIGRSYELPEKLTNDTVKVWDADFNVASAFEEGSDYWERTYGFILECALICPPTIQPV